MTQKHNAAPGPARKESRTGNRTAALRAEKLSALTAILGPETMERLRRQDPGFAPDGAPASEGSDARVSWQRRQILERLRAGWPGDLGDGAATGGSGDLAPAGSAMAGGVDTRIAAAMDMSRLADEHPAVILHVLEKMDRKTRVAALRALPGPVARAALRRLRSG